MVPLNQQNNARTGDTSEDDMLLTTCLVQRILSAKNRLFRNQMQTSLPENTVKTSFLSVTSNHLPLFLELYGSDKIMRNIGDAYKEDKIDSILRICVKAESRAEPFKRYLVIECNRRKTAVGLISIKSTDLSEAPVELGMMLTTKAWGKGISDEALVSVCLYCFEVLQVPAVLARCHPDNKSATAICLRLGYEYAPNSYQQPELGALWLKNTPENITHLRAMLVK